MSAGNEMRKYLTIMRGGKVNNVNEKKDPSMRDLLGKMRNLKSNTKMLNEDFQRSVATTIDQQKAEKEMNNYFNTFNVTIEYEKLEVYDGKGVIFGGTIDGQIQFIYKVTPEEKNSGIEVNYLDDFDSQDPENEKVVKNIESYYDIFYKYWREQLFEE